MNRSIRCKCRSRLVVVVVLWSHVIVALLVWIPLIGLIGLVVAVDDRIIVVVVLWILLVGVDQITIRIWRNAHVAIQHRLSLHRPQLTGEDEHGDDGNKQEKPADSSSNAKSSARGGFEQTRP